MEVVGAVASIVGIIGVTIQALSLIDHLKDFCSEFSDQIAQDFLHDLIVSAGVIIDVKLLCERVGQLNLAPQADFRISALYIQVEDCTKDLISWRDLGEHMTERRFKGPKRDRSLKFFTKFLDAASKSSRIKVRDRLRWHQDNIKTTLSIMGRQFDLANSARLQDVEETVQKIRRKLSFEAKLLTESLDDLSNSSSSMLAHSRTTDERLKDVQSETSALSAEIRDMKNLLRDLSVNSPASSTSKKSNELQRTTHPSALNPSEILGSRHKTDVHPAQNQESTTAKKVEASEIGISTQHSATSNTDYRYEPEFETLLRATKSFIDTIQKLCHPLIAEYISTVNAWRFLQTQLRFLAMELPQGHWSSGGHVAFAKKKSRKMNRAAASQLLSLRKACIREGLSESLQEVDAELDIDETIISQWTEAFEQSLQGSSHLQLESIGLSDPLEVKKDRLTRTNEWILGVFYASPSLIIFHRSIYEEVITDIKQKYDVAIRDRERERERERGNKGSLDHASQRDGTQQEDKPRHLIQGSLTNDAWKRMMLKFWFLDSAADEWSSGPDTSTAESDATVVPAVAYEVEELFDGGAELAQQGQQVVKQLTYRPVQPQDIDLALITEIDTPTPYVSPDKVAEARLILEAYASEPPTISPLL